MEDFNIKLRKMQKLRLILSLIGGIWFIGDAIASFIIGDTQIGPWGGDFPTWIPFLIVGVICIIGFFVELKDIKVGRIFFLITGVSNIILNGIYFGFIYAWIWSIPTVLVTFVGILALWEIKEEGRISAEYIEEKNKSLN